MSESMRKNSAPIYDGPDKITQRMLMRSAGYSSEDLKKPLIAVVNSWTEIVPGHVHLRGIADDVKRGIREAGGTPSEFNTIAVCDGIAMTHDGMHYSLPSRDLITASIEIMIRAHAFDAMVLIGSCDKVVPGMLMAAGRLDIPTIMINGGPMLPGTYAGRNNLSSGDGYEATGRWRRHELSDEQLLEFEKCACPTVGSCSHMATANTMCVVAEALGMIMSGGSTIPAIAPERKQLAFDTGRQIMTLLEKGITARQIITRKSIENAMRLVLTVAGSTNLCLHVPAIAHAAGIDFALPEIDRLSDSTPYLAGLTPCGPFPMLAFHEAGGVPATLKELEPLLNKDVLTVSTRTLGDHLAETLKSSNPEVIHPLSDPITDNGGITVLRGNLAEEGAVVKTGAVPADMLVFEAPARVFDCEQDAITFIRAYDSTERLVILLRYEGPKGGPGMREMLGVTGAVYARQMEHQLAVVTDGRYSGASKGLAIGHVAPEAALGGLIGLVKSGDIVCIDIPQKKISVTLDAGEIEKRRREMPLPTEETGTDVLSLYAALSTSSATGAVLQGKKRRR